MWIRDVHAIYVRRSFGLFKIEILILITSIREIIYTVIISAIMCGINFDFFFLKLDKQYYIEVETHTTTTILTFQSITTV